jgi:dihydroorotate dehydrogenase (NAD+) catalytic subunit
VRLLNASGCLDALVAPGVARQLDGFVTKTVTPEPRQGNRPARIAETEFGMLNSIGLANPGRDRFQSQILPDLASTLDVPIWVSVGGFSARDYAETCEQLDGSDAVAAVELNLSCPNVDEAPESAAEIVAACRVATSLPLYAKLSPAAWDLADLARAVEAAGADGLSLVNTMRGTVLGSDLRPTLATVTGGYSGQPLKPIALAAIYTCRRASELPIVGMGGVQCGRDVLEFVACGATDVALGTILFADPDAAQRVRTELRAALDEAGLERLEDAFCAAHESVAALDNHT